MAGFIKIDKKITNWQWYKNSDAFRVFLHLLLEANYAKSNFKGHEILRGQVAIGRKSLSKSLGISEQIIRTQLINLQKTGEITIKSTTQFSIVTICKYDSYQSERKKNNQRINHQENEKSTNESTTSEEVLKNLNTSLVKKEDENLEKKSDIPNWLKNLSANGVK